MTSKSNFINPLNILRYNEEMNELVLDAQLDFGEDGGSGEVWRLSSSPFDANLVMICRNGTDGVAETALWRIPEDALKEEDLNSLDRLQQSNRINYNDDNVDAIMFHSLTKVTTLYQDIPSKEEIRNYTNRITDIVWNPQYYKDPDDRDLSHLGGESNPHLDCMTVQSGMNREVIVKIWNLSNTTSTDTNPIYDFSIPIPNERGSLPIAPKASWDPHNTNLSAITVGTNIAIVDFRARSKVVTGLKHCHRFGVLDVDYNPLKPMVLCSSGQDGLIKFWDLRFTSSTLYEKVDEIHSSSVGWSTHSPLKIIRGGHTHWVNVVKYNSFHDQLILSGGTDAICNLWRISSISSAPLTDLGGGSGIDDEDIDLWDSSRSYDYSDMHSDSPTKEDGDSIGHDDHTRNGNNPDIRVKRMEMREAIYDTAWSAADPWIYVTLGYDGNIVLNHVPSKEKYKILL